MVQAWLPSAQGVLIALLWVVAPIGLALYLQATKPHVSPRQRAAGAAAKAKADAAQAAGTADIAKNGWSTRKLPEQLDAIVVGSGIGGLTTAALLARQGKRVLVLEQHDVAGGACHTFEERKPGEDAHFTYEFDTGVHYVGANVGGPGCHGPAASPIRKLFDAITDGALQWDPMSAHFDHAIVGAAGASKREVFKVHASALITEEDLMARFPRQKKGVRTYFALLAAAEAATARALALRLLPLGRWLGRWAAALASSGGSGLVAAVSVVAIPLVAALRLTTWWLLGNPLHWLATRRFRALGAMSLETALREECGITDAKLIGMLSYAWGDAGLPPAQLSFATHAMIANHYKGGGYYPRGGPGEIARSIVPVIERAGGAVLVRARVEAILTELIEGGGGTRVLGVRVRGVDVRAPLVVSAVGALHHHALLRAGAAVAAPLPLPPPPPLSDAIAPSCSMLSLFVGLRGSTSELQLPNVNLWCFPSWDHDANWAAYEAAQARVAGTPSSLAPPQKGAWPALFISFSSAKDTTWTARRGACSVAMVLAPAHYAPFAPYEEGSRVKHRGAEYDARKAVLTEALLEELYAQLPHLRGQVELAELGTPLSNNWYLGSLEGEVYGCAANTQRWDGGTERWMRCETEVEGLFRAGADALSPGVAGAAQSGVFCVAAMGFGGLWQHLNLLV